MPIELDIAEDIRVAATPPARFYHDPATYDWLREHVFARSWQLVPEAELVRVPQTAQPFTFLEGSVDEPLVLTRDGEDELRCLSNVCTHRGHLVVPRPCRAAQLRCLYHGRRFGLDGRFRDMPEFEQTEGFPSERDDLPRLPVGRWGPFVFTALDPAFAFEDLVGAMTTRLAWYPLDHLVFDPGRSRDYLVQANWALYCDNYLEGFHIPFVHSGLAETLDYGEYRSELHGLSNLQLGIARGGESTFDLPSSSPDRGLDVAAYYYWLFPNLMFNVYPWGISVNIVRPLAPDRTKISFLTWVGDPAKLDRGAGSGLDRVEREDEAVVEDVQRGVRSRLYDRGRYSPTREQGVHHFHRLVASFMGKGMRREPDVYTPDVRPPAPAAPASRAAVAALAIVIATVGGVTARPVRGESVLLVPPVLDLGEWAAGKWTEATAWVINGGDEPVRLLDAEPTTPGLRVELGRTGTLAPTEAVPLRVFLRSPDDETGAAVTRHAVVRLAGQSDLTLAASVRAVHPDLHLPPPDPHAWSVVRPAPTRLDFGSAAPGQRVARSIWLVNTSTDPIRLTAGRGGCGCLELPAFFTRTIAPGRAVEVPVTMLGQGPVGRERFKYVTFVFDGHDPLAIEARMEIIDLRLSRLHRYLDACASDDTAVMRAAMSLDSRVWIGTPTGPGLVRDDEGREPGAAWDRTLHTRAEHDGFEVGEREITGHRTETGDLDRLLGTPPRSYRVTWRFDEDRLIDAIVRDPLPADHPYHRRLAEVVDWAARHRAETLREIWRDGAPVRTEASARRWRALLVEWRRASGLSPVAPGIAATD